MNTVLDDSKRLCLANSEVIKLSEMMMMMFEVADLAEASPATVSRCGMVFMELLLLVCTPFLVCIHVSHLILCAFAHSGIDVLWHSWVNTLPSFLQTEHFLSTLQALFDWLIPPLLAFVKTLRPIIPQGEMSFVWNMLVFFNNLLDDYRDLSAAQASQPPPTHVPTTPGVTPGVLAARMPSTPGVTPAFAPSTPFPDVSGVPSSPMPAATPGPTLSPQEIQDHDNTLEALFIFATIWSLGGNTIIDSTSDQLAGRNGFSDFLRKVCSSLMLWKEKDALAKH